MALEQVDCSEESSNSPSKRLHVACIFCWVPCWKKKKAETYILVGWLVLWHINRCRLFNAKSIFMDIVLFKKIQFTMSTQFNCQKKFLFQAI